MLAPHTHTHRHTHTNISHMRVHTHTLFICMCAYVHVCECVCVVFIFLQPQDVQNKGFGPAQRVILIISPSLKVRETCHCILRMDLCRWLYILPHRSTFYVTCHSALRLECFPKSNLKKENFLSQGQSCPWKGNLLFYSISQVFLQTKFLISQVF